MHSHGMHLQQNLRTKMFNPAFCARPKLVTQTAPLLGGGAPLPPLLADLTEHNLLFKRLSEKLLIGPM